MERRALVTAVVGDGYRRFYDAHIRPGQERLARRLGCPLVVIERPLASESDVDHPHASWEKVKILEEPLLGRFDRLCWLDADLFVLGEPPDPFALAGDGWLAVDDDTYGVPAQNELGRRWWYGFLPEQAWPERVINTGLFVVHRGHRALLRGVLDSYGGRWDQGPLSHHLLREPGGTLGPVSLNRLVIHHLSARGYGPRSMRELVGAPGMLHFAAASAMRTPDYLAWAERAAEGRAAGLRLSTRAALRALRSEVELPLRAELEAFLAARPRLVSRVLAPWLDARVPRLGPALASVPEWQEHALGAALARAPQLLVSRAQEAYPGWVTVDPVTPMLSGTSNRKFGAAAAAVMVRLEVLRAIESRPPRGLARIVVLDALEALSPGERARFLRGCRAACHGSIELLVAARPVPSTLDARFAAHLALRHGLDRAALDACLAEAGLEARVVSTDVDRSPIEGLG
ncbi:MAG: hypothetical protein K1X94_35260, partial [Sandaracinaceae bacterium]|nr:hypothetical protein [Sandaracinaceae bacterium]